LNRSRHEIGATVPILATDFTGLAHQSVTNSRESSIAGPITATGEENIACLMNTPLSIEEAQLADHGQLNAVAGSSTASAVLIIVF